MANRIYRDNDGVWSELSKDDFYYITDVMFGARAMVDRGGFVREWADYSPYGVATQRYADDLANDDSVVSTFDLNVYLAQVNNGYALGDVSYDPDADFNPNRAMDFFDLAVIQDDLNYLNTSSAPAPSAGWLTHPQCAHGSSGASTDNSVGYDGTGSTRPGPPAPAPMRNYDVAAAGRPSSRSAAAKENRALPLIPPGTIMRESCVHTAQIKVRLMPNFFSLSWCILYCWCFLSRLVKNRPRLH